MQNPIVLTRAQDDGMAPPPQDWPHRRRCTRCPERSWSWTRAHSEPRVGLAWIVAFQRVWSKTRSAIMCYIYFLTAYVCMFVFKEGAPVYDAETKNVCSLWFPFDHDRVPLLLKWWSLFLPLECKCVIQYFFWCDESCVSQAHRYSFYHRSFQAQSLVELCNVTSRGVTSRDITLRHVTYLVTLLAS